MKVDSAEYIRSAHRGSDFLRDDLAQVAFVGRSNVGKSSLMNRLLGRKGLARISSKPGRTRAVNYFLVNRRFYFVDLPGYGYAKAAKSEREAWARLVDRYFESSADRLRVIQLVDSKVGATPLDVQGYEYFQAFPVAVTVAATKIDRLGQGKRGKALASIRRQLGLGSDSGPFPVSARTGDGIKELWREIADHLTR